MARCPTVILVHGFLDSGALWRPIVNVLEAHSIKCIAADLPGMGDLWAANGPFSLQRYADEIVGQIDRAGGKVILVGHSMGAQIIEIAAARRSEVIAGLFLLSPVPLSGAHTPNEIAGALASTGGDVEAQRGARRRLMAQPPDSAVLDALTQLGRNVTREATEQLVIAWNEGVPEGRAPSGFTGPVVVATGASDTFATPEMSVEIAKRFVDCTHTLIKGAGHWPPAEQPDLTARMIDDFVSTVPAVPAPSAKAEDGWANAFGDQSESSFGEKFSSSVTFEATVLARSVNGRERVQTILGAASRLYAALSFTHRAREGDHSYLEWEARLHSGEAVSGITILISDADGKIKNIAIHHRPLTGVLKFSSELRLALAGKIEADLFFDADATHPLRSPRT